MKHILVLGLILCVLACTLKAQHGTPSLSLDFINKIPPQIDGCSGLYTYDTTSMKKKKYIIVTDLQELGFIKIMGKEIKLKVSSEKELSNTTFRTVFKGDGYIITLTTKTGKQIDEVSIETGTLEIIKGSQTITLKVHGEAGC